MNTNQSPFQRQSAEITEQAVSSVCVALRAAALEHDAGVAYPPGAHNDERYVVP